MRSACRPASRTVILVAAALVVVSTALVASPSPVQSQIPTALPGCTNPPPDGYPNFGPQALRQRYGIQPLLDAGFDGQGQTAVLLEFGKSVDLGALDQWMSCLGVTGPPITQKGVLGASVPIPPSPCGGPSEPACFGEAQGDAYSIVAGAPGLDELYILVSDENELAVFADIVDRLRSGALTDGRRPDVVSLSFGDCMSAWTEAEIADTEQSLQALAEAGTWFFESRGRLRSVGLLTASGVRSVAGGTRHGLPRSIALGHLGRWHRGARRHLTGPER